MARFSLQSFSTRLESIDGTEVTKTNILELQKLEESLRAYKLEVLDQYAGQRARLSIESYFELIANLSGRTLSKCVYEYPVIHGYGNYSEVNENKIGQVYLINSQDPAYDVPSTTRIVNYQEIISAMSRILENNAALLFYATTDDALFTEVAKTDEEIILPYGNTIKYYPGLEGKNFRSSIRLTSEYMQENDFPLALRIK